MTPPNRSRPRTAPRTTTRAAIYHRVSSEEQVEGYSLDAQDRATRAYCEAQGWTVAGVYRDEGKSARSDDLAKRPDFARMLADAEAGLVDVVVVHKLDRFARNRRVAFDTLHRLGRGGVGFVSISEGKDFASPQGQLMLTMLVGLGPVLLRQFECRNEEGQGRAQGAGAVERRAALRHQAQHRTDGDGVPIPIRRCSRPRPGDLPRSAPRVPPRGRGQERSRRRRRTERRGLPDHGEPGRNPFTKDTRPPHPASIASTWANSRTATAVGCRCATRRCSTRSSSMRALGARQANAESRRQRPRGRTGATRSRVSLSAAAAADRSTSTPRRAGSPAPTATKPSSGAAAASARSTSTGSRRSWQRTWNVPVARGDGRDDRPLLQGRVRPARR